MTPWERLPADTYTSERRSRQGMRGVWDACTSMEQLQNDYRTVRPRDVGVRQPTDQPPWWLRAYTAPWNEGHVADGCGSYERTHALIKKDKLERKLHKWGPYWPRETTEHVQKQIDRLDNFFERAAFRFSGPGVKITTHSQDSITYEIRGRVYTVPLETSWQ